MARSLSGFKPAREQSTHCTCQQAGDAEDMAQGMSEASVLLQPHKVHADVTQSLQLCFSEHHIFAAGLDGQYLLYVLHLVTFGRVVTLHLFCKSTVRSRESCLCLAREGKFLFSLKQPSSIGREPPNSEVRMRQFS